MPYVNVKTWPGHSEEQKKALAKAIQEDVSKCFGIDKGWVSVGIEDVDPARWEEDIVKPELEGRKEIIYIQQQN